MDLSVIIVSFNVRDFLRQCLLSVRNCCFEKLNVKYLLLTTIPQMVSAEMVRSEFPGIKLNTNNVNLGFSAANNQAIRKSAGRVYCSS